MTLASWITAIRFLLVPLVYWQLSQGTPQGVLWSFGLLLAAGATDIADGWVARARHEISELGKTLDPLADKLVVFFTLLALVNYWHLPVWLIVCYAAKELFQVLAGAFLLRKYRQLIAANQWGKAATVIFFIGFGVYFWIRPLGILVIGAGLVLSAYALYTYYQDYQKLKNS